ncbi:MAG TPA: NDP-sugar synthase [Solirubrobacterales bacterium]|jgi:mannose-1-phosphate guanylyltransferase
MQALVLVGGEGTRLRPLTLTRPKPALPLVDRPFIRFMVDWLGRHGVTEVIMACGFRAEDLRAALGDSVPGGPSIRYVEEREPLGTAGPIRLAADEGLLGERFLVLNGDVLTDLDLTAHMRMHRERGAVASLALYPVDDPTSYGLVRRRDDGEVLGFLEKPDPSEIDTDEVNAGAYVLERSVVDLIPPGRQVSIEREVFPKLVGHGLYGLRLDGYWMDIGTPERYLQASWDILERRVQTEVADRVDESGLGIDEHADVDPTAVVEGAALVDSGAVVGANAKVGPRAVIARDAEVGEDAIVEDSVLHPGCTIGEGATVRGAILGSGAEIGEGATVAPGAVVGEHARIEPGVVLGPDARVEPGGVAA